MANLRMVRAHGASTLDEAKAKVKRVLDEMKPTLDKYIDRTDWNTDGTQARIRGRHVSGTFTVDTANLIIDLKLSLAASLVKGKIQSRIDEVLRTHLKP